MPWDVVLTGGPSVLLALGVVLVLTGQLVPARVLRAAERDRDHWRNAAEEAIGQSKALIVGAEVAAEITRALGDIADPDRRLRRRS